MTEESRDFNIEFMSTPWKAEVWDKQEGAIIGAVTESLSSAIEAARIYRDELGYNGTGFSVFVIGRDGQILDEEKWRNRR